MDLENFENDIFMSKFLTQTLTKQYKEFFLKKFKNIFKILPKIQSPKGALVAPINPFAPNNMLNYSLEVRRGDNLKIIWQLD